MNHNITPEERAGMEAAQRNMAEFAAKDAELVAAVTMAFAAGLQTGEARAAEKGVTPSVSA